MFVSWFVEKCDDRWNERAYRALPEMLVKVAQVLMCKQWLMLVAVASLQRNCFWHLSFCWQVLKRFRNKLHFFSFLLFCFFRWIPWKAFSSSATTRIFHVLPRQASHWLLRSLWWMHRSGGNRLLKGTECWNGSCGVDWRLPKALCTSSFQYSELRILRLLHWCKNVNLDLKQIVLHTVQKLRTKHSSDPSRYKNLQDILHQEISTSTTKVRNSATDALLWLKRGLRFIQKFLINFKNGETNLTVALSTEWNIFGRSLVCKETDFAFDIA